MTAVRTPLIRDRLALLVQDAVARAQAAGDLPSVALPEVTIDRPARTDQGDFATNFALRATRAVGARGPKPMDIAAAISEQITSDPPSFLAGWGPAAPGFLNFTLADDWLRAQVDSIIAEGPEFGSLAVHPKGRVQVEFVSVNPTGPMHVGHARNGALGDSLSRVLARAGWQVEREYYYNDAGAQMEHLANSVWKRYQELLGRQIELSDDEYHGEYVIELAREIRAEHGDRLAALPEAEARQELAALAARRIMDWIETDLARMRVVFDTWFSEANVIRAGDFERVLDILRQAGLIYEREGAQWLRSQDLGDDRDRVVIRSDGRPTYTATDIAYHYDKFIVRKFDRVINVWGADHQGQVPSMKAIVKHMGVDLERFDIVIIQMVSVLERGTTVRMSKREGKFVTLSELLDKVGVDPLRWFLVSRAADSQMDFDVDLARKQSSENPVYYVQYAHARLAKVLRDADPAVSWREGDVQLLTQPTELALIRRMLQLPEMVELAARTLAPHHIPHYAYELARATQAWYDAGNDDRSVRILSDDPALQAARLKLAAAARQVLANALDLIGVDAPESM